MATKSNVYISSNPMKIMYPFVLCNTNLLYVHLHSSIFLMYQSISIFSFSSYISHAIFFNAMKSISIFMCADEALARCDIASLSDQTLLELLISDFSDIESFLDDNAEFFDIKLWEDMVFDDKGALVELDVSAHIDAIPTGSIDFRYIPRSVRRLIICHRRLTGTLETRILPPGLTCLVLGNNRLSGTVDFESLPRDVCLVHIDRNAFEGSVDIGKLPPKVEELRLNRNNFSGSIDVSIFPKPLALVDLSDNQINGVVRRSTALDGGFTLALKKNPLSNGFCDENGNKIEMERVVV